MKVNQVKYWFFWGEGKPEYPEKTSRCRVENQQTQPTYDAGLSPLCHPCTLVLVKTTTWNDQIYGFDDNVDKLQWIFQLHSLLQILPYQSSYRTLLPYRIIWTKWNNHEILRIAQAYILKWRFRRRSRRGFLNSLMESQTSLQNISLSDSKYFTIILVLLTNNITAFWSCRCRSCRRFLNSLLSCSPAPMSSCDVMFVVDGNWLPFLKLTSVKVLYFSSTTQYTTWGKPLGLFWQFRPSTSNYNDTLYYNLLQDLRIRHKTRDRAERQFTQLLLSDGGQKKPAGKKPVGEKVGRKSG